MVKTMTPKDKKLLEAYIKEIAKILYKNTPPEKIETFEDIETSVREQLLEHISPKMPFFCWRKDSDLCITTPNLSALTRA